MTSLNFFSGDKAMEYVQLTLAQMPADRLEEALKPGGLLDRLDRHRQELQRQPGFRDMRVVRSINRQGNVQLVVETRWADDQSLIDYETGQTTVASILEEFRHLLVPGSLQVVDMEALRSEEWWRQLEAERAVRERAVLPLLLPAGVFLFAVLVIYGLSRIYLELAHWKVGDMDAATPLALGISALILGRLVRGHQAPHPGLAGGGDRGRGPIGHLSGGHWRRRPSGGRGGDHRCRRKAPGRRHLWPAAWRWGPFSSHQGRPHFEVRPQNPRDTSQCGRHHPFHQRGYGRSTTSPPTRPRRPRRPWRWANYAPRPVRTPSPSTCRRANTSSGAISTLSRWWATSSPAREVLRPA